MKMLAYVFVLLSLEVLTCTSLDTDQVHGTSGRQAPPAVVPSLTLTDPATDGDRTAVAVTLHGPNICNNTIVYDGIVEETFQFTGTVRKPCGGDTSCIGSVPCTDGFYTTTETGVGVRNVMRKMTKTVPACCSFYKEMHTMCVRDTTTIAVLITIASVVVGVVSLTCGVCCYCCCRRRQKRRGWYGKV